MPSAYTCDCSPCFWVAAALCVAALLHLLPLCSVAFVDSLPCGLVAFVPCCLAALLPCCIRALLHLCAVTLLLCRLKISNPSHVRKHTQTHTHTHACTHARPCEQPVASQQLRPNARACMHAFECMRWAGHTNVIQTTAKHEQNKTTQNFIVSANC